MRKDRTKDQEQKPRRLRLKRETIQVLDDPALLEEARGAFDDETCPTMSHSHNLGTSDPCHMR